MVLSAGLDCLSLPPGSLPAGKTSPFMGQWLEGRKNCGLSLEPWGRGTGALGERKGLTPKASLGGAEVP